MPCLTIIGGSVRWSVYRVNQEDVVQFKAMAADSHMRMLKDPETVVQCIKKFVQGSWIYSNA
jgi:hypothetical protein